MLKIMKIKHKNKKVSKADDAGRVCKLLKVTSMIKSNIMVIAATIRNFLIKQNKQDISLVVYNAFAFHLQIN